MPASADSLRAAVDQSTKGSDSEHKPKAECDEDRQYEEIEVEEEIEVVEEVYEAVEERQPEQEDGGIRDSSSMSARDWVEDDTQLGESTGSEEKLQTLSSVRGSTGANLQPDFHAVESVEFQSILYAPSEARKSEELNKNGKQTHFNEGDVNCNDTALLCDSNTVKEISGKEVTATALVTDSFSEGATASSSGEERKPIGVQDGDNVLHPEPRWDIPSVQPRNLSPDLEVQEGSKKPAVVCEFFAKGWCIKGKSCRFLHVRDHKQGSVGPPNQKIEIQANEGLRGSSKNSGLAGLPDATEKILSWDDGNRELWKSESEELNSHKESPSTISVQDAGTGGLLHVVKGNSHKVSSYATSSERFDLAKPVLSYSLNSSLINYQNAAGIMPSRTSTWSRSSLELTSSYWNSESFVTPKNVDGMRSSLKRSSSPFCSPELEPLSRTSFLGDSVNSSEFISKFSACNWEPSVPFRSSFLLSQKLSSPGGQQYDPIRDSIEQPNIGDGFPRFPSISQGTSTSYQHVLRTGSFGLEFGSDFNSNGYSKGQLTSEMENIESASIEQRNRSILSKEDTLRIPASKKGRREREMKLDGAMQKTDVDFDTKADGAAHMDSKSTRHFRTALIEFVKGLVKPTWREGQLTKNAHKVIVKKTVDKVLIALPPNQVPSTAESVDYYLSSSQPKITKLVEGYIERYGKS